MKSIQEQKMAFAAYTAKNSGIQQLSSHQMEVLKKFIEILSLIKEITRSITLDLESISIIMPYICILTRTLEKNTDDSGICTMKTELLHSLKSHFSGIEEMKKLSLAMFLTPGLRINSFQEIVLKQQLKKCY